ncbi:MAG: NifB/NifX family molybdenum-iron cluster-binding protein [bacterium]
MKVAITAQGGSMDSMVDPRFGRARFFVVCDTETDSFEVVDNQQNLQAMQGAGIQAAQNVVSTGAQVVMTGNCGPKAFMTLQAAGIKIVIGAEGKVSEMLEKFKKGECQYAQNPNVEGHWV